MASWLHINESLNSHSHSHGKAAYHSLRLKRSFPPLKSLHQLRRFNQTLLEGKLEAEFLALLGPKTMAASDHVGTSKWKKMDSRRLGILLSMIPEASRIVVKVLQNEGYDAYLVGGCVRDLLLSKTPKDFDVITTATLQEIKENFHRAFIVGRRFPICRVHTKGSIIEVSNFEAGATDAEEKEDVQLSKSSEGYDEKDIMRWRNSLKQDFTINSLFCDPFANTIYDYSSGMTDLTFLKLRTLIPANLSFKEDCARILRGLRLAARLGLSFAEDTEREIHSLYASLATLAKARLMMKMSSMLSYGSAEVSLVLLKRFNILEALLPFQAAYLACQSAARNPSMLMALFFNLDSVVSCDQLCNSGLWVSPLAFHLALVNYPQDALVIWTLCSVLYHGNWKGVKTARALAGQSVNFVPEILESSNNLRDEELAEKVSNFASIVLDSIDALTDSEGLLKAMGGYQSSPRSLLVFISKNVGEQVAHIFGVLMDDIESLEAERHYYSIDYKLLGKGDIKETRFVLGKVIMETMKDGVSYHQPKLALEKKQDQAPKLVAEQVGIERSTSMVSELETSKSKHRVERGSGKPDEPSQRGPQKQKKNEKTCNALQQKLVEKIGEIPSMQNIAPKNQQRMQEMKDVEELLSLQKILTQKYAKLETGKNGEAVGPMDLLSVLRKAPKMMNAHKAELTPIVSNLEPAKSKDRVKQGSGKPDNEQHQQRPKKQKQNKKTRRDSQQTLVKEKPGKAEAPRDILSALQKAPKLTQEHSSTPILTVSELETPETKESGEQASGKPDDELCRQKPKKMKQKKTLPSPLEQKLGKEKIGQILGTQKNEQQTNSVKDHEQLRSFLKKMSQKDEAPADILSVLQKAPKMTKEHSSKPIITVSELETPETKDSGEPASGKPDDELCRQKPKKLKQKKMLPGPLEQKLVKEKSGQILSTQKNEQQTNSVKDHEQLRSFLKKMSQKDEAPADILSVLQKAPKMTKEHSSKPILTVSELETPETKDSAEQASGKPDDELCRQKPKKMKQKKTLPSPLEEKLGKEKIGQILGTQKNEQQTNSVKDHEQLRSFLKKMSQKDEAPADILSVLQKAPKMTKEHSSKPILTVSELETPETKDSGEQASGKPDDELCRQKPKKLKQKKMLPGPLEQKLVKEKSGQILSTQKNEQQTNSVKDHQQLRSFLKKMSQKDEAPADVLIVLQKAPKMTKEHSSKPILTVSELETPETKDSGEQASGKPDDELCRQKPKKMKQKKTLPSPLEQKLGKEKIEQILGTQKNEQQTNSVKDHEQLRSFLKKMSQKDEAPADIRSVLQKAPKMTKEHTSKLILTVSELETPETKDSGEQA